MNKKLLSLTLVGALSLASVAPAQARPSISSLLCYPIAVLTAVVAVNNLRHGQYWGATKWAGFALGTFAIKQYWNYKQEQAQQEYQEQQRQRQEHERLEQEKIEKAKALEIAIQGTANMTKKANEIQRTNKIKKEITEALNNCILSKIIPACAKPICYDNGYQIRISKRAKQQLTISITRSLDYRSDMSFDIQKNLKINDIIDKIMEIITVTEQKQ